MMDQQSSHPYFLGSSTYHYKPHQTLILSDTPALWMVLSGAVALYASPAEKAQNHLRHRCLICVRRAGEVILGGQHERASDKVVFMAVAREPTTLQQVLPHALTEALAQRKAEVAPLIDAWISALGYAYAEMSEPIANVPVANTSHPILEPGDVFQPPPHTVQWVRIQRGAAQWLDTCRLEPTDVPIPLSTEMWLRAESPSELESLCTDHLASGEVLLAGHAVLLHLVLPLFVALKQRETEAAFRRLQARQQRNRQIHQNALTALASVITPQAQLVSQADGDALLTAMRAVGKALGVPIKPAAALEHGSDPLQAIARESHLRLRRVLLRDRWWTHDGGPLLAYTREGHHPVALIPVTATRYDLFDPRHTTRHRIDAALAATISPTAYTFYRPFPNPIRRWWELTAFGFRTYTKDIFITLLTGLAATLLGMFMPQATMILIDRAIPDADLHMVFQLGFALLGATFGQALFQLAQGVSLLRQQMGSAHAVHTAMWDHLLKLAPAFFRRYATGDLQMRLTAAYTIHHRLSGATLQTLLSSCLALLNLGLMFYYSIPLSLIAVVVALLVTLVTLYVGMLSIRYVRRLQLTQGDLLGLIVQLVNGIAKLRVAAAEARAFAHWSHRFQQQQLLRRSARQLEDNIAVFNATLTPLASLALFWCAVHYGPHVNIDSTLTSGLFLAFNAAFGTFLGGLTNLSRIAMDSLDIIALWERAKPITSNEPEVTTDKRYPGRLTGKITIEHVTFRYQVQGPDILQDVSLYSEPGEFIALVGPSGSGKSTLMRLLLGFESPQSGVVLYDNQDLTHLDISAVRRQLGTVLQQTKIMAASILDNISAGTELSLDDAWAAARAVGLGDDIAAMPMKMHTFISEGGTNLSGGQRQRLLIARALAFKPSIVLFDEATSALDNRTQATVTGYLDQMRATRIVIAHRLSTIRNADRIYVMDQGRIVQQGRFDTLAQQDGLFAKLMARQMM